MVSTYVNTISENKAMQDVTRDNFGKTEQHLARQKLQQQVTNLPGFSEYRIDEDLTK